MTSPVSDSIALAPDRPRPLFARQGLLLTAILCVGALLRLYRLSDIPPPMDADEASRGYDAWCIWETGRDQFGEAAPFFLRSFGPGDYSAAASAWLSAPLIGLLEPGVFGIRVTTALAGVATIALVFGWLRRERGERLAFIAATLLAVNPWHVRMSRWAHEAHITPFLLAAGFYFACRAGLTFRPSSSPPTRGRTAWAFAAGLAFGIGAWSYHAPRLVIPLLLSVGSVVVFAPILGRMFRDLAGRRCIAAFVLGLAIGTLPISLTLIRQPHRLLARLKYTTVFSTETLRSGPSGSPEPYDALRRAQTAARQYSWYFDPVMLGWKSEVEQGAVATGYSRFTLTEVILLAIGAAVLLRSARQDRFHRLLLIWLLLYPLPAALSAGPSASSLRAVCGLPILTIVAAIGANSLVSRSTTRWILAPLAAGLLAHAASTARFYLHDLPRLLSHRNHEELFDAFQWAAAAQPAFDAVYVTPRANQPQALMLLATQFEPRRLHRATRVDIPWNAGFDQTLQIDNWHFLRKRPQDPWELSDLPGLLAAHPHGSRILILCRPYSPSRGQHECPWGEVLRTFSAGGAVWLEARLIVLGETPLPTPQPPPS